jgi:uncharacterized protein
MNKSTRVNCIDFIEFPASSTSKLHDCKQFYGDVFGWRFQDWGDDYSDTKDSGVGSGFNADPAHRPAQTLVVIYSDDLDKTRQQVQAAEAVVTKDIFSFPGGRRFQFKDPAGNELAVWSDI